METNVRIKTRLVLPVPLSHVLSVRSTRLGTRLSIRIPQSRRVGLGPQPLPLQEVSTSHFICVLCPSGVQEPVPFLRLSDTVEPKFRTEEGIIKPVDPVPRKRRDTKSEE